MKIHKHLLEQVAQGLVEVFAQNQYAEQVVEHRLKSQRKWGARDRRFYAENIYNCVRWWRKLWYCLDEVEPAKVTPAEALRAWACQWILSGQEYPISGLDLPGVDPEKVQGQWQHLSADPQLLAVRESLPDWFNDWGTKERGPRWPEILSSLNLPAPVDLRVNTQKISRESLQDRLRQEQILTEPILSVKACLTLVERKNIFSSDSFQKGFFEVQDRGSQKIAELLPVKPGWTVIDACAGGGGKTLQLANILQNKGKIIAMDVHDWKLRKLQERALRQGATCIETRPIKNPESILQLAGLADALLLDVPCSGTGVIRRHPDTKWKLTWSEVEKLQTLQASILKDYSVMLKPGGHLLYATCSVMTSENQTQVQRFLEGQKSSGQSWTLLQELQIDPDQNLGDGFYAALLQR